MEIIYNYLINVLKLSQERALELANKFSTPDNQDIQAELIYCLQTGQFPKPLICVHGYTAQAIYEGFKQVKTKFAAYNILVDLRSQPDLMLEALKSGLQVD